jgi:hypothetical protein
MALQRAWSRWCASIFNVDQCENLPDSISTGKPIRVRNPDTRDELADAFLHSTGADIREGHGEACYIPSQDFISMPAFAGFKGADHFYNVAFHELGHWSGHRSRLDRDLKNRFGSRDYAAEELIAELGASFLCAEFGFDGDVRNAGYIASWIELLKADKRAFFTACSHASKAADYLRGLALAEPAERAAWWRGPYSTPDSEQAVSRSSTSTRWPASALKYFTPTASWKRSAGAALVGSGALAVAAFRQTAHLPARLLRVMQHIGTR